MQSDQCDHAWDWMATEDISCGLTGTFGERVTCHLVSLCIVRMTRLSILELTVEVSVASDLH